MKSAVFNTMWLICVIQYGCAAYGATIMPPAAHQVDGCSLQTGDGLINLWPIGNDGGPRWPYHATVSPSADPSHYSFDPCYQFNQGNCKHSYVCRSDEHKQNDTSVGLLEGKFLFDDTSSDYMIQYIGGHQQVDKDPVITNVLLQCQSGSLQDTLEVVGNISEGLYLMTLKSHCCCPGGCSTVVTPSSNKLSFGSVLCIIFTCLVFVYFVGGMIYMKVARGAKGSEIIPNVGFWIDLPNLIMDGVTFVFSCGKTELLSTASGSDQKDTAYDRI